MKIKTIILGDNKGTTVFNENGTVILRDNTSNYDVPYEELCKAVKIKKTDQYIKKEWISIFAEVSTIITSVFGLLNFNVGIGGALFLVLIIIIAMGLILVHDSRLEQIRTKKSFNFLNTGLIERNGSIYMVYPENCPRCGKKTGGQLKFTRRSDGKWVLQCSVESQHEFEYDHTEVLFDEEEI